nr:YajC, Orf78, RCR, EphA2, ECSOR domain-containing protein [Crepidula fornicata]
MADTNLRIVFISLICVVQLLSCEAAQITLDPPTLTLSSNETNSREELTIECEPPSSGVVKVNGLNIGRKRPNTDVEATTLANAISGINDGDPQLASGPLTDASVTGNVNGKITLKFMAGCNDDYNYTCEASIVNNNGKFPSTTEGKVLKVEVSPGQLTLQTTPEFKQTWAVNETLKMECTGSVGSVETSDGSTTTSYTNQISWVWEYRSQTNPSWMSYDGPASDIQPGFTSNRECYQEQTSILTRRLTLLDNGREYQCYVRRGGTSYARFADTHYVGTVTDDGTVPNPDAPSSPSTADVGAIVGGTIGALVIIVIIVIVVYFLVIRPRRQKAQEEGDNPEKGDGVDWGPVNPAPAEEDPSVTYAKPSRKSKRWDETDKEDNAGTTEGLHYADLDLVRNPPRDTARPTTNQAPSTPTEYASIRLF